MAGTVKPIPEGYHSITPYIIVKDAAAAIDFYTKAFGAKEIVRMPGPDGKIMHAELKFGDSFVMMGEENPKWGALAPRPDAGSPVGLCFYVEKVDEVFGRAV